MQTKNIKSTVAVASEEKKYLNKTKYILNESNTGLKCEGCLSTYIYIVVIGI